MRGRDENGGVRGGAAAESNSRGRARWGRIQLLSCYWKGCVVRRISAWIGITLSGWKKVEDDWKKVRRNAKDVQRY
jgi:hypothetical protein